MKFVFDIIRSVWYNIHIYYLEGGIALNCPKCGELLPENTALCPNCGNEIKEYDMFDDAPADEIKPSEKKQVKPAKKQPPKKSGKKEKPANHAVRKRLLLAALLIIILVLGGMFIAAQLGASEGRRTADKIADDALGRSVEIAETKLGVTLYEQSRFSYLEKVSQYNYIVEDDADVRVCGITLPEWAVFVSTNPGGKISKVTYYDFSVLQNDWRGRKLNSAVDLSAVQFGMNAAEAEKLLGLKPYSVTKTVDDLTIYKYRYYYTDAITGNDKAFSVEIDVDLENRVKSTATTEINFMNFILSC